MSINTEIHAFIQELEFFSYDLSSLDHVWNILFPDQNEKQTGNIPFLITPLWALFFTAP